MIKAINSNDKYSDKYNNDLLMRVSLGTTLGLFITTLFIGTICINTTTTSADSTDTVSINVLAACTMNATDTTHSTNATPGQWVGDIGQSNVTTTCNDPGGYAIYAIGYTNDEYGNTNLINTTDQTKTIATGPNKSGTTSNWSMKLGKGTGESATIEGETSGDTEDFYHDYHIVPSTYTKVAEKTSATSSTITGTSFTTTYGVFTTTAQIAGTYNGQVKYAMVHPSTAPEPFIPHEIECDSGRICYQPNADASETPDTMGDRIISSSATSVDLWASNFQRPGYGFAGWNTEPDYTGTSYGPNETISFTAGQYSGDNPGLSLYAMWIPSAGSLQDFTTGQCDTLIKADEATSILSQSLTALTDTRDNQTYAVARLADGNCWMIENFRLNNQYTTGDTNKAKSQGYDSSFIGLANSEMWSSNSTLANSLYSTDGSTAITIAPDLGTYMLSVRFPRYFNGNVTNPVSQTPTADISLSMPVYSYGNYYTWAAVVADTVRRDDGVYNTTSICPSGWHIPTGGDTGGEFSFLDSAMGGTGASQLTTEASMRWRAYPNNFNYSGYVNDSRIIEWGTYGYYWSSTSVSDEYAKFLTLGPRSVAPGGDGWNPKYVGRTVRCMIASVSI